MQPGTARSTERKTLPEPSTPTKPAARRTLLLPLVLLSSLALLAKGYRDEHAALHFCDFKQPYASSRCLLHACNWSVRLDMYQ